MERNLHGNNHIEVARNLNQLGIIMADKQHEYKKAEMHFKEALDVCLAIRIDCSYTRYNLASAFDWQGNYIQAAIYYEESLKEKRERHQERKEIVQAIHHVQKISGKINTLAEKSFKKNEFTEAKKYYERVFELRKSIYGEESHLDIAKSLIDLGIVSCYQDDYTAAASYHAQAAAIKYEFPDDGEGISEAFSNLENKIFIHKGWWFWFTNLFRFPGAAAESVINISEEYGAQQFLNIESKNQNFMVVSNGIAISRSSVKDSTALIPQQSYMHEKRTFDLIREITQDSRTGAPLFTFHAFDGAGKAGSIILYGHPIVCRSEDGLVSRSVR